jgi:hypothetical protein
MNCSQKNEIKSRSFCRFCSKFDYLVDVKKLCNRYQNTFYRHIHRFADDNGTMGNVCQICNDSLKFALRFYKTYDESYHFLKLCAVKKSNEKIFEIYCCFCMEIEPQNLVFVSHIKKTITESTSESLLDSYSDSTDVRDVMKICPNCVIKFKMILNFYKTCAVSKKPFANNKNQIHLRQTTTLEDTTLLPQKEQKTINSGELNSIREQWFNETLFYH